MKGNTRTNAEMPPESEAHPIAAAAAAAAVRCVYEGATLGLDRQ